MYKIIIKGLASTNCGDLRSCNGISCEDEFTEYFGNEEQSLIDKKVTNGYMHFEYSDNQLWTITTYDSPVELTTEELNILSEYTQGQWSDGIGEGFEQRPCMYDDDGDNEDDDDNGAIYISPWQIGQELLVEQNQVEGEVDYSVENRRIEKEEKLEKFLKEHDISDLLKKADDLINKLRNK